MNDIYISDWCAPTAHSPGSWLVKCSSHPRPGDSSTGQNVCYFDALFELIILKEIKHNEFLTHSETEKYIFSLTFAEFEGALRRFELVLHIELCRGLLATPDGRRPLPHR